MAMIQNPRKEFQFGIIIDGLDEFLCQEVTTPDDEIEVVEHGDTNYSIKTGGRRRIGKLMIDKILNQDQNDAFWSNWADSIQDPATGGGLPPSMYKRNIIVNQYANDGASVIGSWLGIGCFPDKINGVKFSRLSSGNTMERIEFSVDIYTQTV